MAKKGDGNVFPPPRAPRRRCCAYDKTYERRPGSEILRRCRRFFISHLSKSGSCGIKTDTVAVGDLVGRGWRIIQREGERARDRERGGEREREREMRKIMIPTDVRYRFHLAPEPPAGLRVAGGVEMVSGDIISSLFTRGSGGGLWRAGESERVSQATFFFTSFS